MTTFSAIHARQVFACNATRLLGLLGLWLWLLLAQAAWAAADFEQWWEQSDTLREEQILTALERAEVLGVALIFEEIHREVSALDLDPALAERERAWVGAFLAAMERCWTPGGVSAAAILEELEGQNIDTPTLDLEQRLVSRHRAEFICNPYDPRPSQVDPSFVIFEGHPQGEIRIQPDDPSRVAQTLWQHAEVLRALLNQENLIYLQDTSAAIAAANQRWQNFQRHALSDQFPWETLINGWLGEHFHSLGGTLAEPPRSQLRLLHPLPLAAVTLEGRTAFKPRLGVEALGVRRYAAESYAPRWGASALLILPGERRENLGYGALLLYRQLALGVAWQDDEERRDGLLLVLGVDLAGMIEKRGTHLRQRVQQVRERLDALSP
ncbi:hypothetical protein [Geoalkalibacter halelectricus]|uniref:Uncharacterized protein n=1 Tax=Geoalkalibacter halelectricus TaxID=2847045 RepID=A0ABY5ZH59_9BACT|nr:hypothetical protein [Geoalkalibacter halelectricus]MDO3378181.1 hypothetical protein [Geoalkalibacter halelectricus]UWZ78026.1 hypothetical protein L9S41_09965 [Geoalkalibacter halelectricus]